MKRTLLAITLLGALVTSLPAEELFTNTFTVPPTFLHTGSTTDPFAGPEGSNGPSSVTSIQILKDAGITFGTGASAIYNPTTSQLIVRNTKDQMELVEAYVDTLVNGFEPQIYLTFREVVTEDDSIVVREIINPKANFEKGKAFTLRSETELLEALSKPPGHDEPRFAVIGIFSDPQFQVLIRALSLRSGVTILESPSLMTRSGIPGISQRDERRYGILPKVASNHRSIHLKIYLPPHGQAMHTSGAATVSLEIPDGHTLAITERDADKTERTVFVKAQLIDPSGKPLEKDKAANSSDPVKDPTTTPAGISVTPSKPHIVKKGETLASIARDYKTLVSHIQAKNGLQSTTIVVGQLLLVPARDSAQNQKANQVELPTYSPLQDPLKDTIIPSIHFQETPLREAAAELLDQFLKHANSEELVDLNPQFVFETPEDQNDPLITLRLQNVPAIEALRYLTSLAQFQYQLKEEKILVIPIDRTAPDLKGAPLCP